VLREVQACHDRIDETINEVEILRPKPVNWFSYLLKLYFDIDSDDDEPTPRMDHEAVSYDAVYEKPVVNPKSILKRDTASDSDNRKRKTTLDKDADFNKTIILGSKTALEEETLLVDSKPAPAGSGSKTIVYGKKALDSKAALEEQTPYPSSIRRNSSRQH